MGKGAYIGEDEEGGKGGGMFFVGDVRWTCLDVWVGGDEGLRVWIYICRSAGCVLTSEESDGGHNERQRLERDICKSPQNMRHNN